jgi:hypothetical protein
LPERLLRLLLPPHGFEGGVVLGVAHDGPTDPAVSELVHVDAAQVSAVTVVDDIFLRSICQLSNLY